jgi:hypothetical protein
VKTCGPARSLVEERLITQRVQNTARTVVSEPADLGRTFLFLLGRLKWFSIELVRTDRLVSSSARYFMLQCSLGTAFGDFSSIICIEDTLNELQHLVLTLF